MTIWRMRFTWWIPKATTTHSGCVILIAFPLQKWLQERASLLRYTYTACFALFYEYRASVVLLNVMWVILNYWQDLFYKEKFTGSKLRHHRPSL